MPQALKKDLKLIEDDIDNTKISSNNDISDNDSIEEKIRISM